MEARNCALDKSYLVVESGIDRVDVWTELEYHIYMSRCVYPTAKILFGPFSDKEEAEQRVTNLKAFRSNC